MVLSCPKGAPKVGPKRSPPKGAPKGYKSKGKGVPKANPSLFLAREQYPATEPVREQQRCYSAIPSLLCAKP